MKDKIALITGVGRKQGIGAAICRELAKNGVNVFFTYWHPYDEKTHAETKEENPADFTNDLKQYGVHVASAEVDLSQPDSSEKLFNFVEKELGSPDILINNACYDFEVPFITLTPEILDAHYAVNVRAVTMLCKEFVKRGKPGSIINMTSGQSLGSMGEHKIPYTITKAALEMLASQLAPELSKFGITINSVDPGPTDTGWMSEELKVQVVKESMRGRITTPEDIGKLFVSVLTQTQPVTGQIIRAER
jgi:3-oxoacyl-[acyl-carrier protein] reductase